MTRTGPQLGLLVRLFTASSGTPDEGSARVDGSSWLQSTVTRDQFEARLDLAASIGARGIELTQAGQASGAEYLLRNEVARDEFLSLFDRRGLTISALNCSGLPLHPVRGAQQQQLIRTTIELAEQLGVSKIVSMAGIGGDGPSSTTINWGFLPYYEDYIALQERQWADGIALWTELAAFARNHGVQRIGLELHPLHLVYNVPTLLRLREAVGVEIGATIDPSHLFWQSMDPIAVVFALGEITYHVQLKDTDLAPEQLALAGVLDNRPFSDPTSRAWRHRTVGRGHDQRFWAEFLGALARVGYDDFVSIENEDPFQTWSCPQTWCHSRWP
jgi:sugar phosphate isomerase/epimerase